MGLSTAAALAISAGISAAAGTGQGISAARANKRGVKFAREQMKWQEQQTDKARTWQEQMWNKQNAYDSAVQQRSRLQAAGLNPYLMLDGGSAGSATSMPSTDTPGGVGNFDYKPVMDGSNGLLQAGDQLRNLALDAASVAKDNAETIGQEIHNQFLGLKEAAELGLLHSQRDKNILEIQGQRMLNEWSEATMQARIEREKLLNTIHVQESAKLGIDNAISQFNLDHLSESWQSEMEERAAHTFQMYQNGYLSIEQAKLAIANTALAYAQKEGVELSNRVARATADDLIDFMNVHNANEAEYYSTELNPRTPGKDPLYINKQGLGVTWDELTYYEKARYSGKQRAHRDYKRGISSSNGWNFKIGSDFFGNVGAGSSRSNSW